MAETELIRHQTRARLLRVLRVTKLSPRMVRVTLGGDDLEGFVTLSPDDHVKLLFPAEGAEKPVLPSFTPDGVKWPEGAARPVARDYTPRRFDASARELDIDFALHGEGVAARWAQNAQPGQWLGVAGPRGSHVVSYKYDWYLLAGDEAALPSLSRRLEELPAGAKSIAFFEVADAKEVLSLTTQADADVRWVLRSEGQTLESAVREMEFLPGEYFAWISGEVGGVRAIFKWLLEEKGGDRAHIKADGYWKRGTSNHDHHEPIEP
jgi:NADPH-dependent ferric siderophore reductase